MGEIGYRPQVNMMTSPIELLDSIGIDSFKNDTERYAAKEAARRLLARIETPFERIWALAFENPVLIAGLQLCQDLGVWAKWTEAASKGEDGRIQTLDSLLGFCNTPVEPNLLYRFLNHMAALNVLEEIGPNTWKPTAFSLVIGDGVSYIDQGVRCGLDHTIPCGVNLAKFLKKNGYHEPLDKDKFDNYRALFGDDFFAFCQKNPGAGGSFIGLMTALRNHKMVWTDVYDTRRLLERANLEGDGKTPLFVDIGGAHGLDTQHLISRHPEEIPKDVLFVEDLPKVVSTHAHEELDPRIKRVPYDFFTPQPILNSRAYFLHAVPHDWPDADCLRIFASIKAAMKPGYSKLLIYEVVLPARGATSLMTTLDLQLMNCVSGLERTEGHWARLLGEAGFTIVEIFRHPRAVESVIEAEML
ncbi:O-methyltransferase [Apiospora hydei]|uniref:O-methyltransferase n=1 Tax=Apiospora hydei TaxID=1337664 RepID=A0ABR1UXL4_9PEZI